MLVRRLLAFGRLLRRLGLDGHPGRTMDVVEALRYVSLASRADVYHTCRALFVHRREDLAVFDRAFDAFWREAPLASAPSAQGTRGRAASAGVRPGASDRGGTPAPESAPAFGGGGRTAQRGIVSAGDEDRISRGTAAIWSDVERIATKDFAAFTGEEMAIARLALARLVWDPGFRRSRRWIAGRGPRVDVRRALGRSVRTGGDLVALPRRARRLRPRPLVVVADVSGSMERYSRMLVHFAHAMSRRHRRVESFVFSTGLTRITRAMRRSRLNDALADAGRVVPDWSGGTRIGEAIRRLQRPPARRALGGRPVVLIVSDGWDRGDPDVLRDEMARLARNSHRILWLNPLAGTAGYAPLTRGLQAALPFVDRFLAARTLRDLADVAAAVNTLARRKGTVVHLVENSDEPASVSQVWDRPLPRARSDR